MLLSSLTYPHRTLVQPRSVESAVLILFSLDPMTHEPHLLLTKRSMSVETHQGHIAFPGGVCEDSEKNDEGKVTTALRETFEEVGIESHHIQVLGRLPDLVTLSGFTITPIVGVSSENINQLKFSLNLDEIAEIFWIPLSWIIRLEGKTDEEFQVTHQRKVTLPVYQYHGHRVWGATALVIDLIRKRITNDTLS